MGLGMMWLVLACLPALAQQGTKTADPLAAKPSPPPAGAVAATVNGQPVPETAVYRVLRDEPSPWEEARGEILNFLIGNILIDQHLVKFNIAVDPKEVEKRLDEMKKEADKEKQDWNKLLQSMLLTEAELAQQLTCALRWDKYCEQQASDKALRELFDTNKTIFDGSMVHARHILIKENSPEAARAKIAAVKKEIMDKAALELNQLPPQTSDVDKDKARMKALEKAFAESAQKESHCPSKKMGGDLDWFGRVGTMVEPFARAAFELKPYVLSDTVVTEFGYHLIMVVDRKHGKDVKFEDVRAMVREVFFDRLREALVAELKPRAQIVINPAPKY
jgi:parvulin-like peptidyl-prolyl isomerase